MELFDVDSFQRISELETLIKRYQKSYYNGEGEISDENLMPYGMN